MTEKLSVRILSIDIMRGLTLFLMLFVNDLYEPGVPKWLVHTKANVDGMGLADWVFPGFLFMVGLSIPYAVKARKAKGESGFKIFVHILLRALSLLFIGILMLNADRVNPELTGMNKLLWAGLVYISVFLVWNNYPKSKKYRFLFPALRVFGLLGLLCLIYIFKAGDGENIKWLETGWWGILGLIGWGYFTSAFVYLLVKDNVVILSLVWLLFIWINAFSQLGMFEVSANINQIFGVIISGNVPSIVLSGLLVGVLIKREAYNPKKLLFILFCLGILSLGVGFILRNWFIISKIYGTPSWAMICNGISIIVFAALYFIVDQKRSIKWTGPFDMAGKNSLTTYLMPDLIYFTSWGFAIPLFFYKQNENMLLAVSGSIIWALLMIYLVNLLSKINIKLKL
ncbi:hypothetical protein Pedsa_3330 [Pseudopedobacter saltans DSM 12145]|uniref:DUF5009 domain-containing protein n=1 Tax=Pseudopedobacter saltans (strain ATCC 51119 / DSM 12145 / JCM 21818 / CCUG 39354 / LMG 10337 / NBRC 100064 / NCIMB 13643) TaxID=762903 RepID=F0SCM1_PSESL|nr:DUF5009 domain-containing protein [Pseudopedobacter saltans]ADY53865.1 hypothetical protein Pedsa_3330 [Pseudopedobacter saltans DSM 12145]